MMAMAIEVCDACGESGFGGCVLNNAPRMKKNMPIRNAPTIRTCRQNDKRKGQHWGSQRRTYERPFSSELLDSDEQEDGGGNDFDESVYTRGKQRCICAPNPDGREHLRRVVPNRVLVQC